MASWLSWLLYGSRGDVGNPPVAPDEPKPKPTIAPMEPPPPRGPAAQKPVARKAIPAAALLIIGATIAVEGGYVNNPNDPGGETQMGITKKVAVAHGYTGPMRTLPRSVAESIYYQDYLVKPGYAPLVELNAPVAEELFDTTANMGPARPSRWFQQSINELCSMAIATDGQVGQATISAFTVCQNHIGASKLCVEMLDSLDAKQKAEYYRLVQRNPKLHVFLRGWINNRIGNVDRRKCSS